MNFKDRRVLAGAAGALAVVLVSLVAWAVWGRDGSTRAVPLNELQGHVVAGRATEVSLDDRRRTATATLRDGTKVRAGYPEGYGVELGRLLVERRVPVTVGGSTVNVAATGVAVLVVLAVVGVVVVQQRNRLRPAALGEGRGRPAAVPSTRFSDVAGAEEAVEELREATELLRAPERFAAAGARLPRGFLLCGPPGTGKTLLARAVAGEAGVPFFALSGSDFVETYVGVGAARVRQVFGQARRHGRAIIFIDEIDAVGKARSGGAVPGANEERESTLNQLLVEMDGFSPGEVVVLAATNRPDVLDAALLRPGRFDRRITVPAPDRRGRTAILDLLLRRHKVERTVDTTAFARRTPGLTGADLAFLVNEAALESVRCGAEQITSEHLESALATTVLGRERRSALVTDRDRLITAWHEAGHAVAALVLEDAEDPVQVTIVPRGGAGGVTWLAGTDHQLMTRAQAHARLVVAMGGRAAEERLLDGEFTQGAAGDYASATDLARAMVTQYGMSRLGVARLTPEDLHRGTVADAVDTEVRAILDEALDRCRRILEAESAFVEAVADALLAEETIDRAQLEALRPAPAWTGNEAIRRFVMGSRS